MSRNITQRLWSHLWAPANPFNVLKQYGGQQNLSVFRSTFTYSSRRKFSSNRPKSQLQPPCKTSVSKSFASCGILFLDINPTASSPTPAVAAYTTAAQNTLCTVSTLPQPPINSLARHSWCRQIHSSNRRRTKAFVKRNKSSTSNGRNRTENGSAASNGDPIVKPAEAPKPDSSSNSYLHLPHMPKMPHRPTKEELLAAATGFWSRLKVRFKWFSIRSGRPWNIDDWSAFVSWFVLGNIAWIFIGTTTFFSLVILSINTVVAQGWFTVAIIYFGV